MLQYFLKIPLFYLKIFFIVYFLLIFMTHLYFTNFSSKEKSRGGLCSGMCFRISQNSHAKRKCCEISHSHRIAEPFLDSHNFRKMRTKFSNAKNSQNANFRKMRSFRMRIFTKCEFSQNANLRKMRTFRMRMFAKCELMRSSNFREMRLNANYKFWRNCANVAFLLCESLFIALQDNLKKKRVLAQSVFAKSWQLIGQITRRVNLSR